MKRFIIICGAIAGAVLVTFLLPYGTWASIGGLPAHPLVVHGAVISIPIAAVLVIVGVFKPGFLARWQMQILAVLALAAVASIVAQSSGNSLSAAVGLPEEHAEWASILVPLVVALLGAVILYLFFALHLKVTIFQIPLRVIAFVLAIATIVMTVLVGHSGAESVWKDRYASAKVPVAISLDRFTAADVSQHSSENDCWTIINGFVYDMTTFVRRHPSGARAITQLCGRDGTERFNEEHQGQNEPEGWLETLKIGKLK